MVVLLCDLIACHPTAAAVLLLASPLVQADDEIALRPISRAHGILLVEQGHLRAILVELRFVLLDTVVTINILVI